MDNIINEMYIKFILDKYKKHIFHSIALKYALTQSAFYKYMLGHVYETY